MRTVLVVLMLFGLVDQASAQWTFSLEPATARAGKIVTLRVDDDSGCFEVDNPIVERDGSTITVRGTIDDSIPPGTPPGTCPPQWASPRFFSLGTFAPGNYQVQAVLCFNAPPPDECQLQATLPLTVVGPSGTFTVPAASWRALFLLAGALGVTALWQRSKS